MLALGAMRRRRSKPETSQTPPVDPECNNDALPMAAPASSNSSGAAPDTVPSHMASKPPEESNRPKEFLVMGSVGEDLPDCLSPELTLRLGHFDMACDKASEHLNTIMTRSKSRRQEKVVDGS